MHLPSFRPCPPPRAAKMSPRVCAFEVIAILSHLLPLYTNTPPPLLLLLWQHLLISEKHHSSSGSREGNRQSLMKRMPWRGVSWHPLIMRHPPAASLCRLFRSPDSFSSCQCSFFPMALRDASSFLAAWLTGPLSFARAGEAAKRNQSPRLAFVQTE